MRSTINKLFELASFLWMFRDNEPQANFGRLRKLGEDRDYEKYAKAITLKLWELRKELVELRKKGGRSAAPSARWVNFAFRRARACSMMEHIQELARRTQPQKDGVYAFYDLWLALRDLQRQEESCRTSKSEFCLSRAEDRLWNPLEMRGTTTSRLAG